MRREEIIIEKLDHNGRGIARVDECTVFIENALPGEVVNINYTGGKKKYKEAVVSEYIRVSTDRVVPKCQYFGECGGCDLMHLKYNKQLEYKIFKINEILKKFNFDIECKQILFDEQFNYRNKVTLKVDNDLGYYKKNSKKLVPIKKCVIASDSINEIIDELSQINLIKGSEIVIKEADNKIVMNILGGNKMNFPVNSLYINNKFFEGSKATIKKIGDFKFIITPQSFFQVNYACMEKLYNKIKEMAALTGREDVLDLYCGSGTIGIYLASLAKEVLGVEINESSIKDAVYNKDLNKIRNINFVLGPVNKIIENIVRKPDLIIVDPPRCGLDKITIKWLNKIKVKKMIYVSCDPMTLGRDLEILNESYELKEITAIDMFPNTHHVECVVTLCKK